MDNQLKILLRRLIIALSILLVVVTGYVVVKNIKPYNIISVLDKNDPTLLKYKQHLEKYNDENDVYLLLESSTPFPLRPDFYTLIFETAERIKRIDYLNTIRSLNEVEYVKMDGHKLFLKSFFENKALSQKGRDLLRNSPVFRYSYLSPDEKASLIYVNIHKDLSPKQVNQVIASLNYIKELTEKNYPDLKVHLVGTEIARDFFVKEIIKSQVRILPLVLLIIISLLFALFRSWKICLLSLYVMGLSYVATVGLIISIEGSINPFSSFALLFIFIISTADIVHLFSAVSKSKAARPADKFREAISHIWDPCFMCAVTTWVGLLSLVVSDIPPIRNFGIYCAFGVAICFLLTFKLIPWLVSLFDLELKMGPSLLRFEGIPLMDWVRRFRSTIIAVFLIVIFGFGYMSAKLEAGDNLYTKFVPTHPLSQAIVAMDKYFHFTGSIDVVLNKNRDDFLKPEVEQSLLNLQNEISQLDSVAHIKSLSNFQEYIRQSYPAKTASAGFSHDKDLYDIFSLFEDFNVLDGTYPLAYNEVRMTVYLKTLDSKTLVDTQEKIRSIYQKPEYASVFESSVEGFSTIRSNIFNSIFSGFIKSFLLDFIGIFACFLLFFKSLKWSLLALIPNILPLVAVGGLMKALDMTVDYNLIVLVAIIFGIAVDDTTHFIYYLLKKLRQTGNMNEAVSYSLQETSVSLVSTTFIFTLTMPTFFLTDILMFSQVALILVLSLILGLCGDMFVLPALLYSKRMNKNLSLRVSAERT
jgi:predicted RND superfamily exporter protein